MYVYSFKVSEYESDDYVEFSLHHSAFLRFGGSRFAFFYAFRPVTSMDKVFTQ